MKLVSVLHFHSPTSPGRYIHINPSKLSTEEDVERNYTKVLERLEKLEKDYRNLVGRVKEIGGFVGTNLFDKNRRYIVVRIYDKDKNGVVNYHSNTESNLMAVATREIEDLLLYVNDPEHNTKEILKKRFSGEIERLECRQDLNKEYGKIYRRIFRLNRIKEDWMAVLTHMVQKRDKVFLETKDTQGLCKYTTVVNGHEYTWHIVSKEHWYISPVDSFFWQIPKGMTG